MMLYRILQAHGGTLPNDVHVVFANTGKEREETLRFVYECASRWDVRIVWVEYRETQEKFECVGYNGASRNGEPFEALINKKQRLPNWQERWCTGILKVDTMHAYLRSVGLIPGEFAEVIGLRDDEGHRILRGRNRAAIDKRIVVYPLADARLRKADVAKFWEGQNFKLELESWEGNCDVCFMKGRAIKKRILRDRPQLGKWWASQETVERGNGRGWFDRRDRIEGLLEEIRRSPELPGFEQFAEEEFDVECGDACGGDSPEEKALLQRIYEANRV